MVVLDAQLEYKVPDALASQVVTLIKINLHHGNAIATSTLQPLLILSLASKIFAHCKLSRSHSHEYSSDLHAASSITNYTSHSFVHFTRQVKPVAPVQAALVRDRHRCLTKPGHIIECQRDYSRSRRDS